MCVNVVNMSEHIMDEQKKDLETRIGEHYQCIRLNYPQKSTLASHAIMDGHTNK